MKKTLLIIIALVLFPVFSFSASLEPPWKCIVQNRNYEFWYDTSCVEKSANFIDVDTWEIHLNTGQMMYRHMKFNRATGQVAYGKVIGYKYDRKMIDTDLSKNVGWFYHNLGKEEKKLFKILNR